MKLEPTIIKQTKNGMVEMARCQAIGERLGTQCGQTAMRGSKFCFLQKHQCYVHQEEVTPPEENNLIMHDFAACAANPTNVGKDAGIRQWCEMLAHSGAWMLSGEAMK